MKQKTIAKKVEATGISLHKAEIITLKLEPLPEDSGIVFYRRDINKRIKLHPDNVIDTKMATVIGNDNFSISTIEHFLSAVYAYGIDNLLISINGSEMPAMDGSSISFCMLLNEAGIRKQNKNKKFLLIKKEILIKEKNKFVKLKPAKKTKIKFEIDFNHPAIGNQKEEILLTKEIYLNEIARARTFGFAKDIQYLQNIGLAKGASLNNAIGLDDHKILNEGGLRYDNEFVRHKILDAIGDLSLLGFNFIGEYSSFAGSHNLNYKLAKKTLEKKENYEIIEVIELYEKKVDKAFYSLA